MITVLDLAEMDTHLGKASLHEYAGACPGCGGNDRFRVRLDEENEKWAFMCRGCWDSQEFLSLEAAKKIGKLHKVGEKRGWGDEIDYLRHYRGMRYQEAKAFVEQENGTSEKGTSIHRNEKSPGSLELLDQLVQKYKVRLWNPEYPLALEYARSRGLSDDIIRRADLGFSLKGGIPRLIIPSYSRELQTYTTVYRRDLRPDVAHEQRWKDGKGMKKEELYLAYCLQWKRPTVMTEAAIDALSLVQECADLVNVVATGSANCCRNEKALARLARMPLVLVAFDADPDGDKYANWWLKRLKNARRLRPFLHDVNDQLVAGWDIRQWVADALEEYSPDMELSDVCVSCGREVDYYDNDGKPYCALCWPASVEEQGDTTIPEPCPYEQFEQRVHQVFSWYPGGYNLEPLSSGYTLDAHIAKLQQQERDHIRMRQMRNVRQEKWRTKHNV